TSVRQVMHEARVIDRTDGPYPHRASGKLPEIRHQPGMRIAGQALGTRLGSGDFLAIVTQVSLAKAPLEIGPGIHARRAMRLKEHQIAPMFTGAQPRTRMEEMVEPDLEQIGCARVTCNMAAQFAECLVSTYDHGQGIPAHDGSQTLFNGEVS